MKRNMKQWFAEMISAPVKQALPILSFPAAQLLDVSVRSLISDGELQARGMEAVARRVPAAAAVSLMDLSVEAECFGSEIRFSDDEVPTVIGSIICDEDDLANLQIPQIGSGRTGLCIDGVRRACLQIQDRPVLAGIIGPYSLAGRLMDVTEIMYACYDDPDLVHGVLEKVTEFLISYALAFKDAGANGVMMAEPLAGVLSPDLAEEFSSIYVRKIVERVQSDDFAVIYHNCGNAVGHMLPGILQTGCMAYHFGNAVDLRAILEKMPGEVPCMGNLDPAGLFRGGTPETMRSAALDLLKNCAGYPNFIISSGCDIPPMSPWENIDAFFAAVQEFYGA